MTYDLRSLKLPRLGTGALRVFVSALENPLVGPMLVHRLKNDAGLSRISTDDVDWTSTTRINAQRGVRVTLHGGRISSETPGF